jgi:hypothetical protein
MGIKNKFLITGMVATALTIGFLESGTVQLSGPFLYGDENGVSLILKKENDTFEIQPGEKIIINDKIYTYKSLDVASQTLLMENISIPLGDVRAIHYVTGTKMKERGLKGLKTGGMVGAAVGAVLGSVEGYYHYLFLTVPMCAAVDGVALGIVGAGIGYKEKKIRIYNLGENDWRITNE